MKRGVILALVLFSSPAFACTMLGDGDVIHNTTVLCNKVFYLDQGVTVRGSNVTLDCAGAILQGKYRGSGIYISDSDDVFVKNCRIVNYDSAFLLKNVSGVFLMDNHLVRNFVGVTLVRTSDSGLYNYDVSLRSPLNIVNSENNMISASNRFFEGDYCAINYCNRPRAVVESFRSPNMGAVQFAAWFSGLFSENPAGRAFFGSLIAEGLAGG